MRRLLASVLLVLVALGCGESNSPPGNSAADAAKPNACGGELSLTFLGRPASPSDPCGACVNGALVCASPNALACLGSGTSCGDGGMNACGGPNPLVVDGTPSAPGAKCGPCGDGTTICASPELLACIGASSAGTCHVAPDDGGISDVAIVDARIIDATEAGPPRDASDATPFDSSPLNACGGQGLLRYRSLDAVPGDRCGTCAEGILVCESPTSLGCSGESRSDVCAADVAAPNSCGGMGPLFWRGVPTTTSARCGPCPSYLRCATKTMLVCGAPSTCVDAGPDDICEIPASAYAATAPTLPEPPAETAPVAASVSSVTLAANWLLYNPFDFRLYASVGSAQGPDGNSIAVIDPYTGTVVKNIFVGSEPKKMAMSDDGKSLWVALDGSATVRHVDLVTATAGQQFSVGAGGSSDGWFADSLAVLPGTRGSVVVTRYSKSTTATDGPIVYDDGVPRAYSGGTGLYTVVDLIPTYSPNLLFGYDNKSSGFELTVSCVNANGLVAKQSVKPFSGYNQSFAFAQNIIYSSTGVAYDIASGKTLGTFGGKGPVVVEAATRRVFFLLLFPSLSQSATIAAYDMDTFLPKGSETVIPFTAGASLTNLVRWGRYGFAFRMGSQTIAIARTPLLASGP